MDDLESGVLDAANDNNEFRFYVYAWLYPDGRPFYVGKGKGRRDTETSAGRSKIFNRIIAKIRREGGEPRIARWQEGLREEDAHKLEIAYIRLMGRRDNGTGVLANLTAGGEGASGRVLSEHAIAKISEALRGKALSDDHRAKLSIAKRGDMNNRFGSKHSEETLAKMAAKAKMRTPVYGRRHTEETRRLIGSYHLGKVVGESTRLKISKQNNGRVHSEESVANMSSAGRLKPPNKNNKLGLKGVSSIDSEGVYRAALTLNGRQAHLGRFLEPVDAARAYDSAAIEAWGLGNCYLNFPDEIRGIRQDAS